MLRHKNHLGALIQQLSGCDALYRNEKKIHPLIHPLIHFTLLGLLVLLNKVLYQLCRYSAYLLGSQRTGRIENQEAGCSYPALT